jgi:hypothetical protein
MSSKLARRKCRCCRDFFLPDYRNGHHQIYCSKPECRQASKRASQRRWLCQPANRDYFRGSQNTRRMQEWRQAHPGYWKRPKAPSDKTQAAPPQPLVAGSPLVTQSEQKSSTLQDVCLADHPAFIGLISMVTGSTLQEDIASTARKLEARGRDILGLAASAQSPKLL